MEALAKESEKEERKINSSLRSLNQESTQVEIEDGFQIHTAKVSE